MLRETVSPAPRPALAPLLLARATLSLRAGTRGAAPATHRIILAAGEDPVHNREHEPAEDGEPHQNVHVPPRAGLLFVHFA